MVGNKHVRSDIFLLTPVKQLLSHPFNTKNQTGKQQVSTFSLLKH